MPTCFWSMHSCAAIRLRRTVRLTLLMKVQAFGIFFYVQDISSDKEKPEVMSVFIRTILTI